MSQYMSVDPANFSVDVVDHGKSHFRVSLSKVAHLDSFSKQHAFVLELG